MKQITKHALLALMIVTALVMGGCGSFDKDKVDTLDTTEAIIKQVKKAQEELAATDHPSDMKKALMFGNRLTNIKTLIEGAEAGVKKGREYVDDNSFVSDADNVRLGAIASEAHAKAKKAQRIVTMLKTDISKYEYIRANRKDFVSKLEEDADSIGSDFRSRKEAVAAAVAKYPANAGHFSKRMAPIKATFASVTVVMRNLDRSSVSSLYLARKAVDLKMKVWPGMLKKVDEDVASLDYSKTVILKDMMTVKHPKILLVVYDDYDNIDRQVWVPIPESDIDVWSKRIALHADGIRVFASANSDVLAYLRSKCPNYNTYGYQYVEDLDWTETYYHKYITVYDDDTVLESEFKQVDEDTWEDNIENLGMEIYKKPIGIVTDDADDEAALPPGMDKVGNEKYGKWTGQGANRHWSWFETYMFYATLNNMMGPRYISYGDYSSWSDSGRGSRYYGGSRNAQTGKVTGQKWGTASKATKSAYTGKSKFSKTGGYKASAVSARQAARAARGGGPAGGGK